MYLTNFLDWFDCEKGNVFSVNNAPVRVTVTTPSTFNPPQMCQQCGDQFKRSGLIDLVSAVNWRLEFQLKALVSSVLFGSKTTVFFNFCELCLKDRRLHIVATSIKAAYRGGFANGLSKAVVHDLVSLVRLEGLCDEHTLQLSV